MKLSKIFSREYSVQYTEVSLRSLGNEVKKHIPRVVPSQTYLPEQGNEACYVDIEEWGNFISALDKKNEKKAALQKFFKQFHTYGTVYVKVAKSVGSKTFAKASNQTLLKYYTQYQKAIIEYSAYLWMGYFLNNLYSEKVKKLLEAKQAPDMLIGALLSPTKLSGILALQQHLAKMKKLGKSLSAKNLRRIVKKYEWMSCLDIHNDPWTQGDLRQFYDTTKASESSLSFVRARAMAKLSAKELALVEAARTLVYVKDMRDEYRRKGVCASLPLFAEIAKRLGVTRQQLAYFSSAEIRQALQPSRKLHAAGADRRQQGFLIYWDSDAIQVTADSEAIRQFVDKNVVKLDESQVQLKGMPASRGTARGPAKIVLGIKDLPKVGPGDIMIAITTHPDFVPAMHRAAGIVTDEGGLTSHAAIVSRELRIPCIVGAKQATKILKDGDLVEVDANRGEVKQLIS